MRTIRTRIMLVSTLFSVALWAAPAPQTAAPDNTKVNKQERQRPTADQAKNNKSDLQLMREIRRAVVKDKSLSVYAHNVKIIAKGGKVTLKGPVKSDEEKSAVEKMATDVAGAGNVTNDITIKATK